MKPPFAYYGGKTGMATDIARLLPPHRVYLEPFFGAGSVFFAKAPALHEIINDLDGAVVAFFRCLRDRRDELTEACALTPHARREFDAATLDEDLDDLELARRFWVRVNQSFVKSATTQTGFSVTTGRSQAVPRTIASRIGRFVAVADRLQGVTIECCDAAGLVTRLATTETAIYVDPPYSSEGRRASRKGGACADYRHDMGGESEHRRLAEVLHDTRAAVLLSGYHSPLYDELYGDWDHIERQVNVHASNKANSGPGDRTEVLWANYPLDQPRQQTLDIFGTAS